MLRVTLEVSSRRHQRNTQSTWVAEAKDRRMLTAPSSSKTCPKERAGQILRASRFNRFRDSRLRLDHAQMCRLPMSAGWKWQRLSWLNEPGRHQHVPNFRSYEIPNLHGGKIACQQFHWCRPLPFSLLVGQLAARWRAKSGHPPPTLDVDLGFAAFASPCPGAATPGVLRRGDRCFIRQVHHK
jgi:hypothetical protein